MRLQLAAVLAVFPFALRSEATSYPQYIDAGLCGTSDRDLASDWMSSFVSMRVRTYDRRYDDVIKELMKVQCEGGRPEDSLHRRDVIDRMSVDFLLPLYAWDDSLDVRCGCFVKERDIVACGSLWESDYTLRK